MEKTVRAYGRFKKIKMEKQSKSLLFKNAAEALNEYADSIVEEQQGSIFKRSLAKFKAKAKTVTLLGLTIELYELAIKRIGIIKRLCMHLRLLRRERID